MRSFYTAYQLNLRSQIPTDRPDIILRRQRNALIAGRNAMAAHHVFNALGQGAVKTLSDAVHGVGTMINSDKTIQVGHNLEQRIERTLPVPGSLDNTRVISNARRDGGIAAMAATGAAGVTRGVAARVTAVALDAGSAAGKAAQRAAELGLPQVAQQRAALVAAADEIFGSKLTKLGAKSGRQLLKKYTDLNLREIKIPELEAINNALAPKGLRMLQDGVIQRFHSRK